MESFLFQEVNRANRDKDTTKIHTFGPFLCLLSEIVGIEKNRKEDFELYNGDIIPAAKEGGLYGSGKCESYLTQDGEKCVSFVAFRGLKLPMKSIEFHQTMLNQKKNNLDQRVSLHVPIRRNGNGICN